MKITFMPAPKRTHIKHLKTLIRVFKKNKVVKLIDVFDCD